MADSRPVVGLAPTGGGGAGTGRSIVGLAPTTGGGVKGRAVVGLSGSLGPQGKKSGGGGILGGISRAAHAVASKAGLAAHDIKAIPGGLVQTVGTGGNDALAILEGAPANDPRRVKANALGNAILHSTVESLKHPLRDPFLTATTLLPIIHGTGSAAARAGAAADAARVGDAGAAAKAIVTKPKVAPRFLKIGEDQAPLHPSKTVTGRAFQGLYDKGLQRAIDKNPEGKIAAHATRRAGASLDETARYQQRMREAPASALDQAALKLTSKTSRTTGRLHQAALELTSANTAPEDAAAYHEAQAADGVNSARNRVVAKLYRSVADKGLLTKNEKGDVVVDAGAHPKLAQADLALAKVQGRGDEILARYGVRTAEQLQAAADKPGRYRAGAKYETPTPGKNGVSPALDAAVAERDRVAALHEKALDREAKWRTDTNHGTGGKDFRSPMTDEQATARLADLDKAHADLVQKIIPEVSPYGKQVKGSLAKREQLSRNTRNAQPKARQQQTVKSEEFDIADAELRKVLDKHQGLPEADRVRAMLDERDQLRQQLNARGEASIEGKRAAPLPRTGEQPEMLPASNPGRNRVVRLGIRLEAANQKVERLQGAAERRVKPTGVVGAEDRIGKGRGHVSYASMEKRPATSPAASSTNGVVGEARPPITGHANTGKNIEEGLVPKDITGGAARHFRQILRFVNTTERRNAALRFGTGVRRSSRDVLVKMPGEDAEKLSSAIEEAIGRHQPTTDELHGLDAALDAYRAQLVPGLTDNFKSDAEHAVGTTAKDAAAARGLDAPGGYMWVDRNLLGDLGRERPGPRGRISRKLDAVNSAVTSATVYFKVGHVATRVFTNAATNIIQGSAKPLDIAKSVRLWKQLSHEERLRSLAAAGQHGFAAMPHEGEGLSARVAARGANWWARHADAAFRFNSLAYEARKAGFESPAEFKQLLDHLQDTKGLSRELAAKVEGVAKNANREGIAYDRLNSLERNYINRGIWFYPWVKGASVFAGRTLFEHPVKSGILGAVGAQGRKQQAADLGDLPSYEGGLFKVGGNDQLGRPSVADFSTFSPFATPADVLDVLSGQGKAADFLNPAAAGAGALAYKLSPYGQPSQSPLLDSLKTTIGPAYPVQIAEAFLNRHQDQSRRMFPKSPGLAGTQDTILRALIGPGWKRRLNVAAAHSAAARERTGR